MLTRSQRNSRETQDSQNMNPSMTTIPQQQAVLSTAGNPNVFTNNLTSSTFYPTVTFTTAMSTTNTVPVFTNSMCTTAYTPSVSNLLTSQTMTNRPVQQSSSNLQPSFHLNIPSFNKSNASRWFDLLEFQFKNDPAIVNEHQKFTALIGKLDDETIEYAMDVLNDHTNCPYSAAKMSLLSTYSHNVDDVWTQIENSSLGDKRPTILLHDMRIQNGIAKMPESRLRSIFIKAMPIDFRNILRNRQDLSLLDLAKLSDHLLQSDELEHSARPSAHFRLQTLSRNPHASSSKASPEDKMDKVLSSIASLTDTVKQLQDKVNKMESKPSTSNSYSQDHENSDGLCWYHHRWGKHARKCTLSDCPMKSVPNRNMPRSSNDNGKH